MLVSIIIPVYNCEKYLEECISSVIGQNYKNLEIIIVDDGSTDRSRKIEKKFQNIDKRVKVIFQENLGVAAARNKGVLNSHGQYVFYLDADDSLDFTCIDQLVKVEKRKNSDIVIAGRKELKKNNNIDRSHKCKVKSYSKFKAEKLFLNFHKVSGYVTGKLFKRSKLKGIRFDEKLSYGEDGLYFFKVLSKSSEISILSQDVYFYRIRKNSLSKRGENYNVRNLDMFTQVNKIENIVLPSLKKYFVVFKFEMYLSELKVYISSSEKSQFQFKCQYYRLIKFCKMNWYIVFLRALNPRVKVDALQFKLKEKKYEINKCDNSHI